jgi:hypothetical protein
LITGGRAYACINMYTAITCCKKNNNTGLITQHDALSKFKQHTWWFNQQ